MEKENVLELEITALNDEYSLVKVTKINDEVIKEGEDYSFGYANSSTLLMNNALRTAPSFSSYFSDTIECFDLYLYGKNDCFTIKNILINSLETFIEDFNEKYGTLPKSWRAEENKKYFFINTYNSIEETVDCRLISDELRYELGNYFSSEREAKKISVELCKFWKKVRNNKIEEEGKQKE
jgi:hypothetical protein